MLMFPSGVHISVLTQTVKSPPSFLLASSKPAMHQGTYSMITYDGMNCGSLLALMPHTQLSCSSVLCMSKSPA